MLSSRCGISVGILLVLVHGRTVEKCRHDGCENKKKENHTAAGLIEVPNNIYDKSNVCGFYLENNKISSITTFRRYSSLEYISFKNNSLSSIPENAFCGTKLIYLSLESNTLVSVPVFNCDKILPLEILRLSHNSITSLESGSFENLHKLKCINLENNVISSIDPYIFINMKHLVHLNIAHNQITAIDDGTFCCTSLCSLNLASNNLTDLPNLSCIGGTLKKMKLDNNLITMLNSTSFWKLVELEILSLENNMIHYIEPTTFSQISLNKVYISRNQLSCIQLVSNNTSVYSVLNLFMYSETADVMQKFWQILDRSPTGQHLI